MKFVFINPDLRGGGAERVVTTVADGLKKRGHEVTLILLRQHCVYPVPDGVRAICVLPAHVKLSGSWLKRVFLAWQLRRHFRSLVKKEGRPDLVVASLPYAWEIASLAGIDQAVFHVHNNLSGSMKHLMLGRTRRRVGRLRRLLKGRYIIAVSKGVAKDLVERFGVPSDRVKVVYNPFDIPAIRKAASLPIDNPSGPFLVFAARNAPQKRIDVMLDAFRLLDENAPYLVMLTPKSDDLLEMIKARDLSSRIQVLGFKQNPYAYMARSEAVVLSSDHEGFGNVIVEGLACGTRVVSTDCPSGPSEIMTEELSAGLAPVGDPVGLAAAIQRVLGMPRPSLRIDLDRFSLEHALDEFEEIASGRRTYNA